LEARIPRGVFREAFRKAVVRFLVHRGGSKTKTKTKGWCLNSGVEQIKGSSREGRMQVG